MRNQDQFDTTMEEQVLAEEQQNSQEEQENFEPVEATVAEADESVLRTAPTVVVKKNDAVVFELTLEDFPVLIGRNSTNQIILDEKNVSRSHAQILMKEEQYFIQDSGSTGGTRVNGEPIVEKDIHTGDRIEIGAYVLHFDSGDPEDERTIFDADEGTVIEEGTEMDEDRTQFYEEPVAKLIVVKSDSLEGDLPLDDEETILGRDEDAGVTIDDKRLSRHHCKIWLDGDQYTLTDMGSSNGSFVNGRRVSEKILENGDLIQVGSSQFRFSLETVGIPDQKKGLRPVVIGGAAILGIAALVFIGLKLLPQFQPRTPQKVILQKLWEQPVTAAVTASPSPGDVNGDGYMDLVTADISGRVYAMDTRNGGSIWNTSLNTGGGPLVCSPLLADINKADREFDVVMATSTMGVWAVDGATKGRIWRADTGGSAIAGTPAAADINSDGVADVFVGTTSGNVMCLDGRQGGVVWKTPMNAELKTSPRLADVNQDGFMDMVIGAQDYRVHVLDGRNGRPIWVHVGTDVPSTAAIQDMNGDKIPDVVVATPTEVKVLGGTTGAVLWSWAKPQTARPTDNDPFIPDPPAITDLNGDKTPDVIVSTAGGHVYALDGVSGGKAYLWDYGVTDSRKTAPALFDFNQDGIDDVLFGDRAGNLTVVDGTNSHQLNQIQVNGSIVGTPVIADMTGNGNVDIVVGTENNVIVAVQTESRVGANQIVWKSY